MLPRVPECPHSLTIAVLRLLHTAGGALFSGCLTAAGHIGRLTVRCHVWLATYRLAAITADGAGCAGRRQMSIRRRPRALAGAADPAPAVVLAARHHAFGPCPVRARACTNSCANSAPWAT